MGWAKLDDAFPTNPKVVGLSDRAFRCYIIALCYAAQHMTDGFLPIAWVSLIVPRKQRQQLEVAGLWEPVEGGWVIHDYLLYNPSKAQVEAKRAADSERKRGGIQRDSAPESDATPRARTRSPVPSRPVPTGVGVDLEPDTPNAVGDNGAEAPPGKPKTNGKGRRLEEMVNMNLIGSLLFRYPKWEDELTAAGVQGLLNEYGPRAVNEAIDSLYEHSREVRRPYPYLEKVAKEFSA